MTKRAYLVKDVKDLPRIINEALLIATTGRAQAASLYNLAYYLGSSVLGWAGGLVFQRFGWTALALTVIGLAGATAAITAVAHPAPVPATGTAAAGRVTASG